MCFALVLSSSQAELERNAPRWSQRAAPTTRMVGSTEGRRSPLAAPLTYHENLGTNN